ncbi:DUF645 family protein [Vibrio cholerae]|nr:DUF645 family protein [Vibrio cholerae]MCX9553669.1 DUF645 family protein [Vibrio cholerae]
MPEVESVESSAISKSLKANKPRSFNVVGCSHGQLSFTKGFITAEIMLSLSRTLNHGQLNLERFEFWQPTSQLWRWMCVCVMHLHKMTFKQTC